MAILEKVMQMKQQGFTEPEIVGTLRQEGVSPNEINEALSQSKVKSALNSNPEFVSQTEAGIDGNSMQQSMMMNQQNGDESYSSVNPQEYSQQYSPQEYVPSPEAGSEGEQVSQESADYYPDYQDGQAYAEYQPKPSIDIETVNEICEQTVEEKTDKLKKEISSFSKFKEEIGFDVEKMNERLTKIENNFNDLQMAILRRIGSYGEDIKNIAKEMHSTQESFSKMLDPLTDNIRELQKISSKEDSSSEESKEPAPRKVLKKPKTDFESYLR